MDNKQYLKQSSQLSIVALLLLVAAGLVATTGPFPANQEIFEVIGPSEAYSAALTNAGPALRTVLFIDALFALAYTSAISFAILGFAQRNPAVAWFSGLGIIAVLFFDYWENSIMVQSLDILSVGGEVSLDRIAHQASVSASKWYGAAAVLFAVSFLLPYDSWVEKILVWGTRLGLTFAVPLFVLNAFAMRDMGTLLILISMAGGFVLLAVVTGSRARSD